MLLFFTIIVAIFTIFYVLAIKRPRFFLFLDILRRFIMHIFILSIKFLRIIRCLIFIYRNLRYFIDIFYNFKLIYNILFLQTTLIILLKSYFFLLIILIILCFPLNILNAIINLIHFSLQLILNYIILFISLI